MAEDFKAGLDISLSGEDLSPDEQGRVEEYSVEAQKELEQLEGGVKFVSDVIRLVKGYHDRVKQDIPFITVPVENPDDQRIELINQFLGTKKVPDLTRETDNSEKLELYAARAKALRGRYLEIVKGKEENIIRVEIGYPVDNRIKNY